MSDSPRLRTVLVTGSAKRLGREIALALAAGGWQVAVHYRGSAADAQATVADCQGLAPAGAQMDSFQADLGDEAQARALLPRVIARFGAVDAVVNNASMFEHDSVKSFGYDALTCAPIPPPPSCWPGHCTSMSVPVRAPRLPARAWW